VAEEKEKRKEKEKRNKGKNSRSNVKKVGLAVQVALKGI